MTVALDDVRAKRRAFDEAIRHREKAVAMASGQERCAKDLRGEIASVRDSLVAQRAAPDGVNPSGARISADDILEREIAAEAAEMRVHQLNAQADAAEAAAVEAEKAWHVAVFAYAQGLEAQAIRDIETALTALSAACARAVAAAAVSRDHGEVRGGSGLENWFGSGGRLVHELRGLHWPTWPTRIDPCGFKVQYRDTVKSHPGVDRALVSIREDIAIGAPR